MGFRAGTLFLACLIIILAGCGSSSSDSAVVSTNPSTGTVQTGSILVQSVLARAVPSAVDEMRFSGIDSPGNVVFGPTTRPKAVEITLEGVPVTAVRLQIEYLVKGNVVGIGSSPVEVRAGETFRLPDPEFLDISEDLASIKLSPNNPSVARGLTQAFVATGVFKNGNEALLSGLIAWESSNSQVATISPSGVALATRSGQTTISARLGQVQGSTVMTVTEAVAVSLKIAPTNPSLAAGTAIDLVASATLSDGTTVPVNPAWASSQAGVATVDTSTGRVSSIAPGQTTITATVGTLSTTAIVTVTEATLVSLELSPTTSELGQGSTRQLTATGILSNGTRQALNGVTWASSDSSVLNVSSTGLTTGVSPGKANVSAVLNGVRAELALTVTPVVLGPPPPTVTSIDVTPDIPSVALGSTQAFVATATYSDGSSAPITGVTWTSSDTSVATIDTAGLATTLKVGTTSIRATLPSSAIFGEETLTVSPQLLAQQSFETVTPAPAWTYSGGPPNIVSGASSAGAAPPNSPLAVDGTNAWELNSNGSGLTLEFANVTVPVGRTKATLRFRVAAMNLIGSTGGPDNLDYIRIALSTDGGGTFYNRMEIRGATTDNSFWPYSATGVATLNSLPMAVQVFQPTSSGLQTTEGYSTAEIIFDPAPSQIALRITLRSSTSTDSWLTDDIKLTAE